MKSKGYVDLCKNLFLKPIKNVSSLNYVSKSYQILLPCTNKNNESNKNIKNKYRIFIQNFVVLMYKVFFFK